MACSEPELGSSRRFSEQEFHERVDPHARRSRLPEVILGGQDGLVNVLGVILGVAAATSETRAVLAAGLAATLAESMSMAAVAYSSKRAEADRYRGEEQRERRHIRAAPTLERDEVKEIFRKKGFDGDLLDRIVETVTANEDLWIAVMMADEHVLTPVPDGQPMRSALVVGMSSVVGSLLPLVPFFVLPMRASIAAAVILSALSLFVTGSYKGLLSAQKPVRSGLELAVIGLASALVGYGIGALVSRLVLES
jgi:vacuolar iron transporter family protein